MLDKSIRIDGFDITASSAPYIIAEIGSNHDQSLDQALKMIDMAAEAGAHAAKFQLFKADKMYPAGTKLHGIFKSIELNEEWLPALSSRCREAGVHFMASPFDEDSVDTLVEIGVPAFKVASSETAKTALLSHIASKGLPMIISTAMSDLVDVFDVARVCQRAGNTAACLLQCGAMYPLPFEHVNLRAMDTLAAHFGCPVGFSDHTEGTVAAVAAVGRGATVIEKHVTLDRNSDGPDHSFAMELKDLKGYVQMLNEASCCLGQSEKKMLQWERDRSRRDGLYAARDIAAGEVLSADDILIQRPAGNIRKRHYLTVLGAEAATAFKKGDSLSWDGLKLSDG